MQPNPADEQLSYSQSINELENIVRLMQSDKCDIDSLADYTRRATELYTCAANASQPPRSSYAPPSHPFSSNNSNHQP